MKVLDPNSSNWLGLRKSLENQWQREWKSLAKQIIINWLDVTKKKCIFSFHTQIAFFSSLRCRFHKIVLHITNYFTLSISVLSMDSLHWRRRRRYCGHFLCIRDKRNKYHINDGFFLGKKKYRKQKWYWFSWLNEHLAQMTAVI